MTLKSGFVKPVLAAVTLVLTFALTTVRVGAQAMSYSVYFDTSISNDGASIYFGTSVMDSSWGCIHGDYATTASIYSPSHRYEYGWSSGLYANSSISLNGEFGDYTFGANTTYSCSCTSAPTPFTDAITLSTVPFNHHYNRSVTADPPGKHTYVRSQQTIGKACSHSSIKAAAGAQLTLNGWSLGFPTVPAGCFALCYNGHIGLVVGINGTTFPDWECVDIW